jgi:putative ABC transport system permease protein
VVATVAPSGARYGTPAQTTDLYARILDEVRAIPGVTHASTTYSPPLFDNGFRTSVHAEGANDVESERFWAGTVIVGEDYFATNGIRMVGGRVFSSTDRLGAPLVVIVNQAMADALWPGQDPIGRRFEFSGGLAGSADSFDRAFFPDEFMTVVGVAANVRRENLMLEPRPEYYRPHSQITWGFQYLLARAEGDVDAVAESIRGAVWAVDPSIPVREVRTLAAQVLDSVAAQRFLMLLLTIFAGMTSLLAMVGLYAVMTLAVSRRVREMGIRLALGARRGDVIQGVMTRGVRLIVVGSTVGLVSAWVTGRALSSVLSGMLFEVEATDPATYLFVLAMTGGVGLLACYWPARRAGRIDPILSLQQE